MSDVQTAVTAPVAPPMPAPKLGRWANANELPVIDFAPMSGNNDRPRSVSPGRCTTPAATSAS